MREQREGLQHRAADEEEAQHCFLDGNELCERALYRTMPIKADSLFDFLRDGGEEEVQHDYRRVWCRGEMLV